MALKKIKSEDYTLQKVQDNVEESIRVLENGFFQNGIRKTNQALAGSSADNEVLHGLGRDYQGFVVVNKNANADVWLSPTVNNLKGLRILLRASAAVTCDIWIF